MTSSGQRSGGLAGVWPNAGLALVIVAVGMGVGVALSAVAVGDDLADTATPAPASADCSHSETLNIAADPAVVPIVRDLAERYTEQLRSAGRACIPIDVRAVSASAATGRLLNGWRPTTHGPQPDVWIPTSTMWVELLRDQLPAERRDHIPGDPTVLARSPTVLAMPRPMAEALGWPDERLSWKQLFDLADSDEGWGAAGKPGWGPFRLQLADPRYTTTGLQALLALDVARQDETIETGTPRSLFRVQRALTDIDASSTEILDSYAGADRPMQTLSAMPLQEQEVWRYNRTGTASALEAPAASEASGHPQLVAVYPTGAGDIAMESDYPYVILNTPWVSAGVRQFADELGDFLVSDEGAMRFSEDGFRTRDNAANDVLYAADALAAMDQVSAGPPGELPEVGEFRKLRAAWVTVPRLSRTLFLVDVSGSMNELVPGTGQTRLEATVTAAKASLDVIPSGSEVGLWEFSTDLAGARAGGDYRELAEIAPLSDRRGGRSHKAAVIEELDGLDPENDTALNDTVLAAYEQMRESYATGRRHLIVLLTDGRNDDETSITHDELLVELRRRHLPQEPIKVVSIAYGEQPDLDKLIEISETVGGRVVPSPRLKNLERLFIDALGR